MAGFLRSGIRSKVHGLVVWPLEWQSKHVTPLLGNSTNELRRLALESLRRAGTIIAAAARARC
jgi:hypothetical protein